MMRRLFPSAACVLAMTAVLAGQQSAVFRTGVDAVRVDALVVHDGKPLSGLRPDDFEIRDNGVLQTVDLATQAGSVHVVLLLDTSGSVTGTPLERLRDAARAVVRLMQPGDVGSFLSVSGRLTLLAHASGVKADLLRAVTAISAGGRTALRDGVVAGLSLATPDQGRSVLLVLSDGVENASWLSESQLGDAVDRSEVVIYSIRDAMVPLAIQRRTDRPSALLERLTARTGGRTLYATAKTSIAQVFSEVLTEFRARYLITYTPRGVTNDGGWHTLSVSLKAKPGKVTAREGYQAGPRSK